MCPFSQSVRCRIQRKGFFGRQITKTRRIQRYRCLDCEKSFSDQTATLTYREKAPHWDQAIFRISTAGISQRKCAELLGVHRTTVARKLMRLAAAARRAEFKRDRDVFLASKSFVFDEMETFEHTKMKPLSIVVAVDEATRLIAMTRVAVMPATGLLAERSRKKYGYRRDDRPKALRLVLSSIGKPMPNAMVVKSDDCPRYPHLVRQLLPGRRHERHKGRRGCVVGQGELKRGGFDPLFALNHSCAMIQIGRAHV